MKKNVKKRIKGRKFFDESTVILSSYLRIFNSTHLFVRDILDCLTYKDFVAFVYEVLRIFDYYTTVTIDKNNATFCVTLQIKVCKNDFFEFFFIIHLLDY